MLVRMMVHLTQLLVFVVQLQNLIDLCLYQNQKEVVGALSRHSKIEACVTEFDNVNCSLAQLNCHSSYSQVQFLHI